MLLPSNPQSLFVPVISLIAERYCPELRTAFSNIIYHFGTVPQSFFGYYELNTFEDYRLIIL